MNLTSRKLLLGCLVLSFVGQSALVYGDSTADRRPKLDGTALEGRAIWHRENCQSCHQLYGFGGFLGPDLTNAASRINRARLDEVLTNGSLQMPAFGMSSHEIDAIEAWLRVVDRTGIGQARRRAPVALTIVEAAIEEHARENPMPSPAQRGYATFMQRCVACHTPFRGTPLGVFLAPDLSTAMARLGDAEIDRVLQHGRPERGMPAAGLADAPRAEIVAFLAWLGEHEPVLRTQLGAAEVDGGLPWFEYR